MNRSSIVLPLLALLCSCSGSSSAPALGSSRSALVTSDECTTAAAAATNGKVELCHATHSAKNPFVDLNVGVEGCINGHSDHPLDFIPFLGPGSCVPPGARCCGNCCGGLTCVPLSAGFSFCEGAVAPPL